MKVEKERGRVTLIALDNSDFGERDGFPSGG